MPTMREIRERRHGFVLERDMPEIIAIDRLQPLLVRCGGCRFQAPAQDVARLIQLVEAGGEYVRDVSFPTQSHL